ncbi:hypothetical protein ACH5RR_025796 [Cinchona calisaya]|uniref:NAC domain-containing protein n=1 Tax=Cinchona calisaya TaxID=153742 RepID=A0ABD2Z1R9_9GENT
MGTSNHVLEMPIGYRFVPTDEELVTCYLTNKVLYRPLPAKIIQEIDADDLYSRHPKCLVKETAYGCGEGERKWYFLIYQDEYFLGKISEKLMVGNEVGFWSYIGEEEPIFNSDGDVSAFKIYLNYFSKTTSNAKKTNWRMEKYRLPTRSCVRKNRQVEEWIVGRIICGRQYNEVL